MCSLSLLFQLKVIAMSPTKLAFKRKEKEASDFYPEVKRRVKAYFDECQIDRFANMELLIKGLFFISMYLVSYGLILSQKFNSPAAMLFLAAIMGMSGVCIVSNFVHDASHRAVFRSPKLNKMLTYIGDIVGINTYIWHIRHNVGGDIIIENVPIIRLSQHQPYKWFHSYQVFYAPFLYILYSLFWMSVIDIKLFFKKDLGNMKDLHHLLREWVILWASKAFYVCYALVIPMMVLDMPKSWVLLGFFAMHLSAGMLLSPVALVGHFVEGPDFPHPDEHGLINNSWAEHELEATIDFANDSRLANWIMGGLNTHIAHHLFPNICHVHYYNLTPIIRKSAQEYGLEYGEESFPGTIRSHFKYLARLSHKKALWS